MIKNDKQLSIAKNEVADLQDILVNYGKSEDESLDFQKQRQRDIFLSRIDELNEEITEYEYLTSASTSCIEINSAKDDIKKSIISMRIASGLTQKQLADKLEIHEQQIQRYEQQDYLTASFERIIQILRALDVEIHLKKTFGIKTKSFGIKTKLDLLSQFKVPVNFNGEKMNSARRKVAGRKQVFELQ